MIHVLKFICAIMVICIHCDGMIPHLKPLCRVAVPIFCMISGYFIINDKGTLSEDRIKRVFFKVLNITIIAKLIYIFVNYIQFKLGWIDVVFPKDFDYYLRFLITGKTEFGFHLWYLWAYLQALVVIWLSVKLKATKLLFIIAPIGLIIGLFLGTYSYLFNLSFESGIFRNVITVVLPFVIIGSFIRRNEELFTQRKSWLVVLGLTVFGIYVEYLCLHYIEQTAKDIMVFTILCAPVLFILCLQTKLPSKLYFLRILGAHHSLNIYIYHVLVIIILGIIIPGPLFRVMVIICTLAVSFLINKLSIRYPYILGWLNMA